MGFVENSSDPEDLQAWCDACEALFIAEGDMTECFRQFNDFAVVCDSCYAILKARHIERQTDSQQTGPATALSFETRSMSTEKPKC